jgi:hypothetical protein
MLDDMPPNLYAMWVFAWTLLGLIIIPFSGYWIYECYQGRRDIQPAVVTISRESFRRQLYPKGPLLINKIRRHNNYSSINHSLYNYGL